MTHQSKTSVQVVKGAEVRDKCLELRKLGMTYQQIGENLGIRKQAAHAHVSKALKEIRKKISDKAEEVKVLELERLDKLMALAWRRALQEDLKAINTILNIMKRRADLLGLDAPQKIAPTTSEGDEAAAPGVLILPETAPGVEQWLRQYRASPDDP